MGGSLRTGADWYWYSDAAFTVSEGSGASISVDPAVSTTYYVRAEETATAAAVLVTVKDPSTDPTSITITNDNTCQGTAKTLTVVGGSLGTGADWYWYSDAGFSVAEGSGASISVDPATSTTYYVRAEGDCNSTAAVNALVTVWQESLDPTGTTISTDNTCQGTAKTLTVVGGSLGDGADWHWYSDAGLTISEGVGVSISVDPAVNTTYYVRAEGPCNNTLVVTQLVQVLQPSLDPIGTTIANDSTCQGSAKTLSVVGGSLGDGAEWYWYSDAAMTVMEGTGVSLTVDPAVNVTYYVRAEGDCNTTIEVSREVQVLQPSMDPTGTTIANDSTCQGTAKTLSVVGGSLGDGADWYWYSDAAMTVLEGTGPSLTVDPAVNVTYYVRAEGDCNTTVEVSREAQVLQPSLDPTGTTISNDSTCQGTAKTLSVVGGSLGDGADWYWYSDAAMTVLEGTGVSLTVDPAVNVTYYVRAEGDCNNTVEVSREVQVLQPSLDPTGFTITDDFTCEGTAKVLTVQGGSLGDGADWFWYSDAAMTVLEGTGASITVDPDTSTFYYVRAEGDCNLTAQAGGEVRVKNPSLDPSGVHILNDSTCQGTAKTLVVDGGLLGEGADWYWYSDAALTVLVGTGASLNIDPAMSGNYYVRAEGDCNITLDVSAELTVLTASQAATGVNVTNDDSCPGTIKILDVTGGVLGDSAEWYWAVDPAFASVVDTGASIQVDPAVSTTYYVRAEGACNITAAFGRLVSVKIPSIEPDSAYVDTTGFCSGSVATITLSFGGGLLGTGAVATWYTDPLFLDLPVATGNDAMVPAPLDTTVYYVRFEGECDTTLAKEVQVVVNPVPSASIAGDMVVCSPDTLVYVASGLEGSVFQWTATGGTIVGADNEATVTVVWEGDGLGNLQVLETSLGNCLAFTDSTVVRHLTPTASEILGGSDLICTGDTGVVFHVDGFMGSSYDWYVQDALVTRDAGDSIYVNWEVGPGLYEIRSVETSVFGCVGRELTRTIEIVGPDLDLGDDTYICEDDQYAIDLSGLFQTYLWMDGSTGPVFQTNQEGMISVTVGDSHGCYASDSLYLQVQLLPEVELGQDTSLCGEAGVVLDAGEDGVLFEWSTGDVTQTITMFQGERQEIWVEVEDEFGCISRDTVVVKECDLQFYFRDIPTAITPGDLNGQNDTWVIHKLEPYPQAQIEIFDRWGTMVWKSDVGYSSPWDGRNMNGNPVPMDSYHFVITLSTGSKDRVTGIITVIR
ncbi:MAG: gliding motility-associated C-terminal domain-containing protein [Bacteroidales bacterium]